MSMHRIGDVIVEAPTRGEDVRAYVPVVALSNGLRVANFSSPHPFTFVDGHVLPACAPERAQWLMLEAEETRVTNHITQRWGHTNVGVPITDIILSWKLTPDVMAEVARLHEVEDIDIVLVPLPVMQALKEFCPDTSLYKKCRVIRTADRVAKTIYIDKFCR